MVSETGTPVYKDVLDNMRKVSETSIKMQQDMFREWTAMWPGFPNPQTAWLTQMQDFQRQWSNTITELAQKHRQTIDQQYQAAIESLESALRVGESTNPEEFRQRAEELCRKAIDCMRECSEAQVKEFQEAITQWTELTTKSGK